MDRAAPNPGPDAIDFESVYDAVLDPVLTIDESGTILTCNPAVIRVFGWSRDELVRGDIKMLMAEPHRSAHEGYIESYLKTGIARAIGQIRKVYARHRDGHEFPCELSVAELHATDGQRRFVGVIRDLTEREELTARLAQAERLAAVGELAAGVAHEINNPVNTIINCAQLIRDGDDDPELSTAVIEEGLRIASIVRDLLDFSRDRREEHSSVSLAEVTKRTVSLIAGRFEKQGVDLVQDVPDDLPWIQGRAQNLQQVLLNLLLNARDAVLASTGPSRRIAIRSECTTRDGADWVTLSVRDNGIGIAPEHRERVFEPFFTTKRDSGGTGLGLAVSHGIVAAHGGHWDVRTQQAGTSGGGFTEFVVRLPIDEPTD